MTEYTEVNLIPEDEDEKVYIKEIQEMEQRTQNRINIGSTVHEMNLLPSLPSTIPATWDKFILENKRAIAMSLEFLWRTHQLDDSRPLALIIDDLRIDG